MNRALQCIPTIALAGWIITTVGNFVEYWQRNTDIWNSANALLMSEVCVDNHVRVAVRHFDRCEDAKHAVSVSPLHRSIYQIGQDLHVCGHRRCEILYIDITERLTIVLSLTLVLLLCIMWRWIRHSRIQSLQHEEHYWKLPLKIKNQ